MHSEVILLEKHLKSIWDKAEIENWTEIIISPKTYKRIGELQGPFQSFYSQYLQMSSFVSNGVYATKKRYLQLDLISHDTLFSIYKRQEKLIRQDLDLAKKDFEAKSFLFKEKIISEKEFREEQSRIIGKEIPIENIGTVLVSNYASIISKQRELLDIDQKYSELKSSFLQSLNKLISDIESWKREYLLISPLNGKVLFQGINGVNQEVINGQDIFFVAPKSDGYFGELFISQTNFGKVKVGQKVLIDLKSYPYQEYGRLNGKVEFISSLPNSNKQFTVKVLLDDHNSEIFEKKVELKSGLIANSEIITNKTNLMTLIFRSFYKLIARN